MQFVLKSHLAVRRRSALGTLARKFSKSKLAKTCRTLSRSGLFDRDWYLRQYDDVRASRIEPVAHYILCGAFEGRNPNRVFDTAYYLKTNPDVYASGLNPLLHYIRVGEKEKRKPSQKFDPEAYHLSNPDVRVGGGALLKHFLRRTDRGVAEPAYRPKEPEWSFFEKISSATGGPTRQVSDAAVVDVVIPVFKGYSDTLACIASVLSSVNQTAFELVVINDASPDERLTEALIRLETMGLLTLLQNDVNLGFVKTINRGMSRSSRDVIILNSDTLVFNNWIDRLRIHAIEPAVGTVTPFTNNGEICSYPIFCANNPAALEIEFAELDQLAALVNKGRSLEVPTGVGFCMYITRAALDSVGYFDFELFGLGYGEENDFCLRASELGFSNKHALDTFVFHSGAGSFGAKEKTLKRKALQTLTQKYPDYQNIVGRFIERDPARVYRAKLDVVRMLRQAPRAVTLVFTHSLGGGVEKFLSDRSARMPSGEAILAAYPDKAGEAILLRADRDGLNLPNVPSFDLHADEGLFAALLVELNVTRIEVHSTVGWSASLFEKLERLRDSTGISYDVHLHDYTAICPQVTLIDDSGVYCGETGVRACDRCLLVKPGRLREIHPDADNSGMADIRAWRETYHRFLLSARSVVAPSEDTRRRVRKYFPDIDIRVEPHPENHQTYSGVARTYTGGLVKVAVIGAIGPHKGSNILLECARDAIRRSLPLEFVVVGYTNLQSLPPNLKVTGRYEDHEVFSILDQQNAHVVLLPSVLPETYCYTLSIALSAGFPVYAFDFGAPAERLASDARHVLMPLALMTEPASINDLLLSKSLPSQLS
nr:glycosyltransferase [Hyphomicrobium sp. 99]